MKLVVIKEHKTNYPYPIGFKKGESLFIGKSDTEFEGWIYVTTSDGNQGWAPKQYLEIKHENSQATANQDYNAKELDTCLGEELILLHELNDWGWVKKADGTCGWVPMKTIKGK